MTERRGGIEQRGLVLLQIAIVGERQALQGGEERNQRPRHPSRLPPHQLRHVGVLLLWHHRAPGREGVGQLEEAELVRRPEDEVLGESGEMHRGDGCGSQELDRRIAIGHRVDAVLADAREAQLTRQELPVEGKSRARERAGAERELVAALPAVAEACPITGEHLAIGEQVVGEEDRLGSLEVGVPRDDRVAMLARERDEDALQAGERCVHRVALGAEPEAEVECDLIVAAPSGVELAAERAEPLDEAPLDGHVDVLVGGEKTEAAALELAEDGRQPALDPGALPRREQLGPHERAHVRPAARDVVGIEHAIDGKRRREGFRFRSGGDGETSGPGLRVARRRPRRALHRPRSTSARMRSRSAASRMNPPASSCR